MKKIDLKTESLNGLGVLTNEETLSIRGGDNLIYWIGHFLGQFVPHSAEPNSTGISPYDVALQINTGI